MKKTFLNIAITTFICLLFFNSCKKDDPQPEEPVVINTTPPVFNWKINNTTSFSSDSTSCYQSNTSIYAYKNGRVNSIEKKLPSLNTGTYSISSVTGNELTLLSGNVSYSASSGTVIIKSNNNNKLSGSLTAAFSTGTVTSLSGEFTDITRR